MFSCFQFCAILFFGSVTCNRYYQIIGSKNIRPRSDYHLSVSINEAEGRTFVRTILEGVTFNGSAVHVEAESGILPYSTEIFTIKVPPIPPGVYRLQVLGRNGLDFSTFYPLNYLEKSFSVLVETDKAVYNPGSTVSYRVIILNSQLKPVGNLGGGVNIGVVDADGNVIEKRKNVTVDRGIFSDKFKLSKKPVLGNWNITVDIQNQQYFKTIRVAKYIVPSFRINIETKKHITFKSEKIVAKITSRYHHGDNLQGEAKVSAFPTIFSHVIQPIFQNPVRKVVPIDGSAIVEFDITNELNLNDEYERIVILDVTVDEKNTGRRENVSEKIHLHKYEYKIDLIKTSDYFKPGLKYTAYAKISRHDGLPIDGNGEVIVHHGFSEIDETPIERRHNLDENGVVKLEFLTPTNVTNITALRIEVQFKDLKEKISPIATAVSHSANFISASLETDKCVVNLDVEIAVTATEPLQHITYVVFGRGDVLIAKTLQVGGKKEFKFRFRALQAMAPLAHLVVSYVRDDGEMIGDTLDFEVTGILQNFLEVKSSTVETEPGFDMDFQIKSQPYSFIGLMAIDEKNQLLGTDNEISNNILIKELLGYDSAETSEYMNIMRIENVHFPWKPGGSNIYDGIQDCGGDLVTNAHVLRKKAMLDDVYLRPAIYDGSTVKPDRGFGLPIHAVTRPPLAGPYAFSRIPVPVWQIPKVYLDENIENTWLFNNFSSRYDGVASTRVRLPHSLSNWRLTGFALDPVYGLGIMKPKSFKTSRQFYVKLDLPYRVLRGETINLPVHIYNNVGRKIDVEITLHNSEKKFEFTEVSNEVKKIKNPALFRKQRTKIDAHSNGTVWFLITPLNLGNIEIKVTGNTPNSQDSIFDYLRVMAEGETEYYTKSEIIDLRTTGLVEKRINFTIPKNAISGSEKIEIACIGNLLGPIMKNLDTTIRKPTGCGEQNLLHMMTSLLVLKHLKSSRQNSPDLWRKANEYLEEHYQNQLAFKRTDGAFSAFGQKDQKSSVWLTAYALMVFRQASEFIYIDENVIRKGYEWLASKQGRNGSFYETGVEYYADMQNIQGNSLSLTAFVLSSFIENQKYSSKYSNLVNKGLDYLARYIDEKESTYSVALCSYVFQISGHPSKRSAFNLLDSRAKYKDGLKWWSKGGLTNDNPWKNRSRSVDIEMSSYALLTFLENNLLADSVPILNWLLKQQNDNGGFSATQDTVMGLQSLYLLMSKLSIPPNVQLEIRYSPKDSKDFHITKNNAMFEERFEVNKDTRDLNVTARGTGLVIFKVYYHYNKDVTGPWPMFVLDPQIDRNSDRDHVQISICIKFVKDSNTTDGEALSNMAVMEVNLPSGYTADVHSLPSLEVSEHVEKVETQNQLNRIVLYFNNLSSVIEYCPTVSAFKTFKVANQKPVPVVLYDYYDTSRRARVFYSPPKTTVCDICTDIDCESACVISPKPQIREGESRNHAYSHFKCHNIYLPFLLIFVLFLSED